MSKKELKVNIKTIPMIVVIEDESGNMLRFDFIVSPLPTYALDILKTKVEEEISIRNNG